MGLKELDILSPPITLYYQGFSAHSSWLSGVLSIIAFVIIVLYVIYEIINLWNRDNQIPKSTSYVFFSEDVGTISFNTSSLFHFISIEDSNNKGKEEFNFSFFNIIGMEEPITNYENKKYNINNYNHWLYGNCDNEIDIKGVENIKINNIMEKAACIRK